MSRPGHAGRVCGRCCGEEVARVVGADQPAADVQGRLAAGQDEVEFRVARSVGVRVVSPHGGVRAVFG